MIKISIGIMAGGRSSRMGENKAYLPYQGTTFLHHLIRTCEGCGQVLVSVDKKEKYQDISCPLVEDEQECYGPVEGIYQLIRQAETEYILILATDMPLVSKDLIHSVTKALTGEEECLALCLEGKPQPFCSVYSKKTLSIIEKMREQKERKPRLIFERSHTRYVNLEDLGYSSECLDNINDKEEYRKLMQR